MREKQILNITPYEDIISYECNYPGKFVKVLIGSGTLNAEGIFVPYENQNYEYIMIDFDNYDILMAAKGTKPANVFRKEDLWPFVDSHRAKLEQKPIKSAVKI